MQAVLWCIHLEAAAIARVVPLGDLEMVAIGQLKLERQRARSSLLAMLPSRSTTLELQKCLCKMRSMACACAFARCVSLSVILVAGS